MKIPKEQLKKIILWGVVCIIVIVVLITLVFSPNLRKIGTLRANIRKERSKVVKAEKEVLELAKIKLNLKRLEDQIEKYQQDMPLATPDWLLERLNTLANEIGIEFDRIEPKGYISQIGPYGLQGLYVELKTDYHRLGRFINKLENLSPFIKVIDLSIAGNKDDIRKHIIKITVGTYVKEK